MTLYIRVKFRVLKMTLGTVEQHVPISLAEIIGGLYTQEMANLILAAHGKVLFDSRGVYVEVR